MSREAPEDEVWVLVYEASREFCMNERDVWETWGEGVAELYKESGIP